ncbi:MAG: aldehyde:ferredoxin oxidoreductase [Planctomycetota bacterium]|jgi:aldehyde:ferredoxin oxidoreductase
MRPTPQLLRIDLARLPAGAFVGFGEAAPGLDLSEPTWTDPLFGRLAAWSGTGLALAYLLNTEPDRAGLTLALGEAVRRGVPTAGRLSVLAPSALHGRLAEGLVGSDLARRLATVCDVLALSGCAAERAGVLVVEAQGVRLLQRPEWAELDPEARRLAGESEFGDCAMLRSGPAGSGKHPVAFANLAAGGDPASFVGRGLAGALAAHGLLAIVICAEPEASTDDRGIGALLAKSPRLLERAHGGTLEQAAAMAARGSESDRIAAEALRSEASSARTGKHGCHGCPTPCGWSFSLPEGGSGASRFRAVRALGSPLGLEGFEAPNRLLAACNRLGLDAKEAGSGLALLLRAADAGLISGGPVRGDVESFLAALEDLQAGRAPAACLAPGVAAATTVLGLEQTSAGKEPQRAGHDLGALLGACAGARGSEPMRSFPFLLEGGSGQERLATLLAPWTLPAGAADPDQAAGTGRVVAWHEDLIAGVDLAGFCAFSAAGLLADGVTDLDGLALAIAPAAVLGDEGLGHSPGARLLTAGASLHAALRLLAEHWGLAFPAIPEWAAERLAAPGVLDEYRVLRGLSVDSCLAPERAALIGMAGIRPAPPQAADSPVPAPAPVTGNPVSPGLVRLHASGSFGRRLGSPLELSLALPARAQDVIALAAEKAPKAADWLLREGSVLPAIWRDGKLVPASGLIQAGDELELVLAIAGG